MAVLPDNNRAVSGCADCTLRLWSLKSGELIRTLSGHDHWVTAVAVLPDGHRAVSASLDRTLKLWDLEDGQQIRTFLGPTDPKKPYQLTGGAVTALAVLPDSRHALFASDTTLRLLDIETGETVRCFIGHQTQVNAVAILPDGRRAISGSSDYTLRLWDLETSETIRTFQGLGPILAVAVLPDGRRAVSGSFHTDPLFRTIRLWDLETGALITFFAPDDGVSCIAVARDDMVVAGDNWGAVHILKIVG